MDKNQLIKEIQNLGPGITAEAIDTYLAKNDRVAESIAGSEILAIVSQLSPQASGAPLATRKKGGAMNKRGTGSTAVTQVKPPVERIEVPAAPVLPGVSEEVEQFREGILEGRDRFVSYHSRRLAQEVLNTPAMVVQGFSDELKEAGYSPEGFRREAGEFSTVLFPGC